MVVLTTNKKPFWILYHILYHETRVIKNNAIKYQLSISWLMGTFRKVYLHILAINLSSAKAQNTSTLYSYTYGYIHIYIRGPQPWLGTGPHSRRWVAVERAKLHLPLPTAPHYSHYLLNHPHPRTVEKLSSTKLVPGAKKVGDRWYTWQQQTHLS